MCDNKQKLLEKDCDEGRKMYRTTDTNARIFLEQMTDDGCLIIYLVSTGICKLKIGYTYYLPYYEGIEKDCPEHTKSDFKEIINGQLAKKLDGYHIKEEFLDKDNSMSINCDGESGYPNDIEILELIKIK